MKMLLLLTLLAVIAIAQFIPLAEVLDWNARPLSCGTVFLFDSQGKVIGTVKVVNGELEKPINATGVAVIKIAWGWVSDPAAATWIYDSSNPRDVMELGNALSSSAVRTYVYPITIYVEYGGGMPVSGLTVVVAGLGFYSVSRSGADGSAQIVDTVCGGELSQIPPGNYTYYVYDPSGALVASGRFAIARGAPVLAGLAITVGEPRSGVGSVVVSGVRFSNGSVGSLAMPVVVEGGRLVLLGELPPRFGSVAVYLRSIPVGNVSLPARGGAVLVYNGSRMPSSLAELGLYVNVTVRAVDMGGALLRGSAVQVWYGGHLLANGTDEVRVALPRSDLLGGPYTAVVASPAVLPNGRFFTAKREFSVGRETSVVDVRIPAVYTVVRVVDGFGEPRRDWRVEIVNVTSGLGEVRALLIEGEKYVARAIGLGFTNTTVFTPVSEVSVVIPTALVEAYVVDGFGRVREDWPVEIVGVASGRGKVGPVEVIAGEYTARAEAFGRTFLNESVVEKGQRAVLVVHVPTAKIKVAVLEENGKPPAQVYLVVLGPVTINTTQPALEAEVLAGEYVVRATADGRNATERVVLKPGEVKDVVLMLPPKPRFPWEVVVALAVAAVGIATAVVHARRRSRASKSSTSGI
ncbi:hypothetical protein TUZN_0335 [Thermoproteus uzoniensis 768-20]|uniref:Uncharacterized protein n=1 Tax=Thermoproteus uzoniensis (strain 768-20) TaxID=999630 RepID=F2L2G7_THEU7|nr:hypothetical protein [Thermoproteus uzoniensis]AEA11832.1 hypothetical protein TUZN_0335 [Thermoproteus uzoniensis 768-20]